ncbi:hypothetical protein P8452_19677 [Trifolium repens]|nr:hypothetical protein P8452_19677 [Trifolium repens]
MTERIFNRCGGREGLMDLNRSDVGLSQPKTLLEPHFHFIHSHQHHSHHLVIGALTGTTVLTCYASYAYNLEETDEKTKLFRESAKVDGATALNVNQVEMKVLCLIVIW